MIAEKCCTLKFDSTVSWNINSMASFHFTLCFCRHIIFFIWPGQISSFSLSLTALLLTSFSLHFTICSPSSLCLPVKHSWSPTFLFLTISNQGICISLVNLPSRSFPETARSTRGGVLQRDGRQPWRDAVEVPRTPHPDLRPDYPCSFQHHWRPWDQHGWPWRCPAGTECDQPARSMVKQASLLSLHSVLWSAG